MSPSRNSTLFFASLFLVAFISSCSTVSGQSATVPAPAQFQQRSLSDYSAPSPSDWQFEPTLSGGYSNVHFNSKNALPYNPEGGYIDANVYAKMPSYESPIIGLGISATGNWDTYSLTYPTVPFSRSFYANTDMFSAEVRIAFPFGLPSSREGFYCLPRVGIGALCDNYTVGQPYYAYPGYFFGTETTHTGVAVEVRPDIEVGYRINRFNIGCEASYMAAWGNFGKLGTLTQELRLGLLIGVRF